MRRRMMYVKPSGGRLPGEYIQLNYLQNDHAGAYIDTGIKPNQNTEIEVQYKKINGGWAVDAYGMVYGSRVAVDSNGHYYYSETYSSSTGFAGFSDIQIKPAGGTKYATVYTVRNGKNGCYVNGALTNSYDGYSDFQSNLNMYLFGLNGNGSVDSRKLNGLIYYFKVWEDGSLIQDLIPVQRISDGVYGMYDFVSGAFFTNAGTGNFTGG